MISEKLQIELNKLNPQQLVATIHDGGPALVLAGAGSGKTKVLTTRAAWLMAEKNLQANEILLVTFTNKAAAEMRKRVSAVSGFNLEFSGTFHSLCAKIMRKHAPKLGLSHNFTIYDSDDQLVLLKNIYKAQGWDIKQFKPASILGAISRAKNNMQTPGDYEETASGSFEEFTARAYKLYQINLKQEDALDFDDLLNYVVWLFRDFPDVLGFYQQQIKHVLVDEYQDTNKSQYLLTKYLSEPQNNLFAVGDFSQSIYAWRGADYKNMVYLEKDFPGIKKYFLEQNYRSLQAILDAATQVISQNSEHPILELWTDKKIETKIGVLEAATSQQEAVEVIKKIDALRNGIGGLDLHEFGLAGVGEKIGVEDVISLNEIAILYRTNAQSRSFEEALTRFGIPYRLVGGFKFYDRKEVKDLLCYLRILCNPKDSVSLTRATKIGKRRLAKFEMWKAAKNEAARESGEEFDLSKPMELLREIIEVTKYRDFFEKDEPEDIARWENVEELLNAATLFESTTQFLENIALIQDDYLKDAAPPEEIEGRGLGAKKEQVTLMSLHSAKGLEYEAVFLVGMEEGLLPHSRSLYDQTQLEEERRLCYVGITRAKSKLHLSFARQRWQYGETIMCQKSRFISEIDASLLENEVLEDEYLGRSPAKSKNGGHQKGWFEGGEGWKEPKPAWQKNVGEGRTIVIDEGLIDDFLRDDVDITEFLSDLN